MDGGEIEQEDIGNSQIGNSEGKKISNEMDQVRNFDCSNGVNIIECSVPWPSRYHGAPAAGFAFTCGAHCIENT